MAYGFNDNKSKAIFPVILWENASPRSSFADQTITLSDHHTNYDYIEIILAADTSCNAYSSVKLSTSKALSTTHLAVPYATAPSATTYVYVAGRVVHFNKNSSATTNTLTFDQGYRVSVSGSTGRSADNNYCIPVAIIGYKY